GVTVLLAASPRRHGQPGMADLSPDERLAAEPSPGGSSTRIEPPSHPLANKASRRPAPRAAIPPAPAPAHAPPADARPAPPLAPLVPTTSPEENVDDAALARPHVQSARAHTIVAPTQIDGCEPIYTRMAIEAKVEGEVEVLCTIRADGVNTNCRII